MTYIEAEQSKERAVPYELYTFTFGPNPENVYRYTNAVEAIDDYEPIPIQRDQYKTTGKAERDQMNIRVPISAGIAQMILPYPPPHEVSVEIRQGHFDQGDAMVVWVGRLLSNAYEDGGAVVLTCESTLISLKRQGVRRRWQVGCPLLLYSEGVGQCNANRDDFTVEAVVVDFEDSMPVFNPGWNGPWPIKQFITGMLQWTSQYGTEYRSIRQTTETKVIFNGPLRGVEIGMTVKLILGCNHRQKDCREVFDNILNYGGDPWMPLQNPVRNPNFW